MKRGRKCKEIIYIVASYGGYKCDTIKAARFILIYKILYADKIMVVKNVTRDLDNDLKMINSRITALRMQHGVKQSALAERIGISQTNLSNIERGRTAVTLQNLLKIRAVLGCKMADFFVDIDGTAEDAGAINPKDVETVMQFLKLIKSLR